jgi:hypothetical protein
MTAARHFYRVLGAAILAILLLMNTTTGRTETQDLANSADQAAIPAATAEATTDAAATASDFPAIVDQIAEGPHTTVKSSDGKLLLMIPDGALPSDVAATQITTNNIRPNTVPVTVGGNRPLLAYRFEPDGLQFSTPAVIVLTMNPFADNTLPMLFSVSGEKVEAITSILYATDPKTHKLIVTAPIAHFSEVVVTKGDFGILFYNIFDQVQNDPFTVEAVVFRQSRSPVATWALTGGWAVGWPIEPRLGRDVPIPPYTTLSTGEFRVRQKFTCKGLSAYTSLTYVAVIGFDLTVAVKKQTTTSHSTMTFNVMKDFRCIRMVEILVVTFANFTTTYTLGASHPEVEKLAYAWSNSNSCGDFNEASELRQAKWLHPHTGETGSCPDESSYHPGTINVVVSSGRGASETVTYPNGSAVGLCRFDPTSTKVDGPCTITP